MEEKQKLEPDYQKGFNEGYTIAKHLPDLADKLSKAAGESNRSLGFKDGCDQFLSEREKYRYPSWLTGDRFKEDKQEPTQDKDKDIDIEPDR